MGSLFNNNEKILKNNENQKEKLRKNVVDDVMSLKLSVLKCLWWKNLQKSGKKLLRRWVSNL